MILFFELLTYTCLRTQRESLLDGVKQSCLQLILYRDCFALSHMAIAPGLP